MRTDGLTDGQTDKVDYGTLRFIIVLTTHQANQRRKMHLILLLYGMEV